MDKKKASRLKASINRKLKMTLKWDSKEECYSVYSHCKSDGGYFYSHLLNGRFCIIAKSLYESLKGCTYKEYIREIEPDKHDISKMKRVYVEEIAFLDQLKSRGYDEKSLKVSVQIKRENLIKDFPHVYENLTEDEKDYLRVVENIYP